MQTRKLILLATAAGALFTATTASADIDDVNLGTIPVGTSTLTLYNGLSPTGVPDASGAVGSRPAINGIVTSSPGSPSYIYQFTVNSVFNVFGEVDGPFINFSNAAIFSGTPASPTGTAVAGQVFCGCGPEEGGFALTTLNETWTFLFNPGEFQITHANLALSPGSYFLELSNPQLSSWENNPKSPDYDFYPVAENLTVTATKMNAPEIDPLSAVTALTLLAGSLLVFRGRREVPL